MTALGAIEEGGVRVINCDRECRCWGQDKPRPDSCVSITSDRRKYLHRWDGKDWRNQPALRSGSIDQIIPESNDTLPTRTGIQLYLQLQPLRCSDYRPRNQGERLEQHNSQPAQRFQRRRAKHLRLFSSFDKLEPQLGRSED